MGEFEIFANRIKQLRESLNMTQMDFSKHIGVKQQTLSGYERGLMKPPLDVVTDIAKKCNVSIDWLCGLTNKKNNDDTIETYADVIKLLLRIQKLDLVSKFDLEIVDIRNPLTGNFNMRAGLFTDDPKINTIIQNIEKMLSVLNDGTINQDIFDTWLDGFLEKYNDPLITWDSISLRSENRIG